MDDNQSQQIDGSLDDYSDEYRDKLYDVYLQYRSQIDEREFALEKTFTTTNIAVAGGALAISLTLAKDWQIARTTDSAVYLIVAWALLVLAVLMTLVNIKINQRLHHKYRQILDEETATRDLASGFDNAAIRQKKHWLMIALDFTDYLQLFCTVAGIGFLVIATLAGVSTSVDIEGHKNAERTKATAIRPEATATDSTERATISTEPTASEN